MALGNIQNQIVQTANRYGVPPEIALGVARRESNFDNNARGKAGEVGMFQLMPSTAREVGVDPYSIEGNIEGGVRYLVKMFNRFGDWNTALMAYNAGPGNVSKGKIPESSKKYASKVGEYAGEFLAMLGIGDGGNSGEGEGNSVIAENGDVMPQGNGEGEGEGLSNLGKGILTGLVVVMGIWVSRG